MKTIKIRGYSEVPKHFTGIAELTNGSKTWWLNGKLHREYGPAIEWADGTKLWCLNGQWHRVDGPAWEGFDGTKHWYLNDQRHRTDGPAIEFPDGTKRWWLNGKCIYLLLEPIGDYILVEDGLPSEIEWLGNKITQCKVLTAKGIMYLPNLPGL
jgi:hypothetical protein